MRVSWTARGSFTLMSMSTSGAMLITQGVVSRGPLSFAERDPRTASAKTVTSG
jgi:hypothetical protein